MSCGLCAAYKCGKCNLCITAQIRTAKIVTKNGI